MFFRFEYWRAAALNVLLGALCLLPAGIAGAEDPASWRRWLDSGPSPLVFSRHALSGLPDTAAKGAIDRSDATEALLDWTSYTVTLIQKYQQNPQRAARTLALVHAAMHDAFVAAGKSERAETSPAGLATAHRAVSLTLAYLFPYESVRWIEGKGLVLAYRWAARDGITNERLERELTIGEQIAGDAIRRALSDGSDRRTAAPPPLSADPGRWRGTPPLNIHVPQEPLAGEWLPWLEGDQDLQPPPPPAYGSAKFWEESEEVYRVWKNLTPRQKKIAEDWNLQAGSVTPPGVWNLRAIELVRADKLGPAAAARALAALNIAMNDAAIACWRAKYRWWKVRPVTVIRERYDADFLPHLVTPPHPSYVSGHSAVSGGAEAALAAFFPGHRSDLHAYAEEAAMSRLWGGIHYRSDNEEGLALGRRVGERVAKRALASDPDQREAGSRP
jgi:membrane-associated phospholipid phosphatase